MHELIGKIARRYTFCLHERKSKRYIFLVSFIDVLLPDMEGFLDNFNGVKPILYRDDKVNFQKNDKVYLSIDYFTITQDFLEHPETNFMIGNDQISFEQQIKKKLNHHITIDLDKQKIGLGNILPKHNCLTYLDFWQDESCIIEDKYGKKEPILKQLATLSNLHLNFDLSLSSNILGNLYILHYNSAIKNIHVKYSDSSQGIYLRKVFRPHQSSKLYYFFCNKQSDNVIYEHRCGQIEASQKYHFIPLNDVADKTVLYVWDDNNNLVYVAENLSFIMSVSVNLNVKMFDVKLDNQKTYEKFESEQISVLNHNEKVENFSIANEKAVYEEKENCLDFVFLDGSDKKKNMLQAQNFISKILDSANDRLYICDPYFDINVLFDYIFSVKNVKVNIKILMEKTWHDIQDAKKMLAAMNDYNKIEQLSSISCKVLNGDTSLHDRYIIADDTVWLLGTSLNNIGEKISTIIKIPSYAAKNIVQRIDSLWYDGDSDTLMDRINFIESINKKMDKTNVF